MMFGSVLATLNESFSTPMPMAQTSITFHRKPVIRLISDAIAILLVDRARDGGAGLTCSVGASGAVAGTGGMRGNIRVSSS